MQYIIKVDGQYLAQSAKDGYSITTHPDFAAKYDYKDAVEICYIINKRSKNVNTAVMEEEETI